MYLSLRFRGYVWYNSYTLVSRSVRFVSCVSVSEDMLQKTSSCFIHRVLRKCGKQLPFCCAWMNSVNEMESSSSTIHCAIHKQNIYDGFKYIQMYIKDSKKKSAYVK
jgi:hypothetical protein